MEAVQGLNALLWLTCTLGLTSWAHWLEPVRWLEQATVQPVLGVK